MGASLPWVVVEVAGEAASVLTTYPTVQA